MKECFIYSMLTMLLMFSITACSTNVQSPDISIEPPETMFIQRTKLQNQQNELKDLTYKDVLKYVTNDAVERVELKIYHYANGKWIDGDLMCHQENIQEGTVAIGYDYLRVASVLYLTGGWGILGKDQFYDFMDGYHSHVAWMEGWENIEYGKEIPLTMQILTKEKKIKMPKLDIYFTPEEIEKLDYKYVSVAVVTFYDSLA